MKWRNHKRCIPIDIPYFLSATSTTERARRIDPKGFEIHLRHAGFERALPEEAICLKMDLRQIVWVREVNIYLLSIPVMFARAVVPYCALESQFRRIPFLENASLGAYLFDLPMIKRMPFEIKCFQEGDCLYDDLMAHEDSKPNALWARRSIFCLQSSLLLTEVFLPGYMQVFRNGF